MGMTEVQKLAKIKVLEDLYKEYELLAKYNGGRDYDRYCALELAIDTMRKYQKLQADYENRLRADMVAMLTELQMEIEELNHKGSNCYRDGYTPYSEGLDDCKDVIQQKISALRGVEDGND